MDFHLTDDEWEPIRGIPDNVLVDLAADLGLLVPEALDRRALLDACVPLMVARGQAEGLPLSEYDREDLVALPPELLGAVAAMQGAPNASVDAVIQAGLRVWRRYERDKPDSPFALCLPMLLRPIARAARFVTFR